MVGVEAIKMNDPENPLHYMVDPTLEYIRV